MVKEDTKSGSAWWMMGREWCTFPIVLGFGVRCRSRLLVPNTRQHNTATGPRLLAAGNLVAGVYGVQQGQGMWSGREDE